MATVVSAPLPELDLKPGTIIVVTLSDPSAVVQRLVIHGRQEAFIPGTNIPAPLLLTSSGGG